MINVKGSDQLLILVTIFSVFISGCANSPSGQVTPVPSAVPSQPVPTITSIAPTIKVISYPASVDPDTDLGIDWTVSGGTPGNISRTAIIWGFNRSNADVSGYPEMSAASTGRTPQQFNVSLEGLPTNGTIYFRAYATVDGVDIYSDEYQTVIVPPGTGGN